MHRDIKVVLTQENETTKYLHSGNLTAKCAAACHKEQISRICDVFKFVSFLSLRPGRGTHRYVQEKEDTHTSEITFL